MIYDVVLENPRLVEANFEHGGTVVTTVLAVTPPSKREASRASTERNADQIQSD